MYNMKDLLTKHPDFSHVVFHCVCVHKFCVAMTLFRFLVLTVSHDSKFSVCLDAVYDTVSRSDTYSGS